MRLEPLNLTPEEKEKVFASYPVCTDILCLLRVGQRVFLSPLFCIENKDVRDKFYKVILAYGDQQTFNIEEVDEIYRIIL